MDAALQEALHGDADERSAGCTSECPAHDTGTTRDASRVGCAQLARCREAQGLHSAVTACDGSHMGRMCTHLTVMKTTTSCSAGMWASMLVNAAGMPVYVLVYTKATPGMRARRSPVLSSTLPSVPSAPSSSPRAATLPLCRSMPRLCIQQAE